MLNNVAELTHQVDILKTDLNYKNQKIKKMESNYNDLDNIYRKRENEISELKNKMDEFMVKQNNLSEIFEENQKLKKDLLKKNEEIGNYINKIEGLKIEFQSNMEANINVRLNYIY